MSWQEQIAVRESNLYEQKGLAKPLLSLIAQLIINTEEGEEPDADEGWCVATEDYLAMSLACSIDAVYKLVKMFRRDGWIEVKKYRNKRGHWRNNYRLLRLQEIKERKTPRDENFHFIREKNPRKKRGDTPRQADGRFNKVQVPGDCGGLNGNPYPLGAVRPDRSELSGLSARCPIPTGSVRGSEGFQKFPEQVRQQVKETRSPTSSLREEKSKTKSIPEPAKLNQSPTSRSTQTTRKSSAAAPPCGYGAPAEHQGMCHAWFRGIAMKYKAPRIMNPMKLVEMTACPAWWNLYEVGPYGFYRNDKASGPVIAGWHR